MPSAAEALHDQAVLHRVGLGRYSTALVRSVVVLLNDLDADIMARITRDDLTDFGDFRWKTLLSEVRRMQAVAWASIGEHFTGHLEDLTEAETAFHQRLVEAGAGLVNVEVQSMRLTVAEVVAAVKARPFQGLLLAEWLTDAEEGAARRVRRAIQTGQAEGQSVYEIVRRIRGTKAKRYTDGILEMSRNGAEAMVRTAVTHVSSVAANEVYTANDDIVEAVEWVATLDSRTTKICAGLDGRVYPLDKGPRPPAHISCRSTTIPRLVGMKVFERTTFADWLGKQPVDTQDDVLGPVRAQLWRGGDLKLEDFVDNKGAVLTLDQLRERDASAFKRAGL